MNDVIFISYYSIGPQITHKTPFPLPLVTNQRYATTTQTEMKSHCLLWIDILMYDRFSFIVQDSEEKLDYSSINQNYRANKFKIDIIQRNPLSSS